MADEGEGAVGDLRRTLAIISDSFSEIEARVARLMAE
jgi:hypothetical protein